MNRTRRAVVLVVVVLAAAAAGVATREFLDRPPIVQQDLPLRPPAPPEMTGSAEARGWHVRDPGQRSFQAIIPDRRPEEIRPPAMPNCGRLMAWAQQEGGIVLGTTTLTVDIVARQGFRVETLRPSVIGRDQPAGVLVECHFIRYDGAAATEDDGWRTYGLTTTDIPAGLDDDSFIDEANGGAFWYNEFRLDPGDCANCAYELLAQLRMHDDGRLRAVTIARPEGTPLRVGATRADRVPDLTWCEETIPDVDGDGSPETLLRQTDFHTVVTTDRCGGTPLQG